MVSDRMLIFIISMLVEPLKMLCAEAADALAPRVKDLKAKDLRRFAESLVSDVC